MPALSPIAPPTAPPNGAEWHIASLVVYTARKHTQRVAVEVAQLEHAEVHALSTDTGKLVVTLEAASADQLLAQISHIQHIDGVFSAALVYQCADTLQSMNEEIPDADRPT
jgi:periplasmic nitrate reductase NapD